MGLSRKKKKAIKIFKKKSFIKLRLNNLKLIKRILRLKFRIRRKYKYICLYYRIIKNLNKFFKIFQKLSKPLCTYRYRFTLPLLRLSNKAPQTPSKRHLKHIIRHRSLNQNLALKSKLDINKKSIGKNLYGQIISYHRQVGLKRRFRIISEYRLSLIHQGIIEQLEYSPNHSCLLARVYNNELNYHFYIRAPISLKVGFKIKTNMNQRSCIGDSNTLYFLMLNKPIHNISLNNTNNIARSAGSSGLILQKYLNYSLVQFPSKKRFYILTKTQATMGQLTNPQKKLCNLGKAGRNRWLGRRPHVRGVAMNPIDHPHGGGQGKTSGGQPSVSPWGKPTKQIKHRKFAWFSRNKQKIKLLLTPNIVKDIKKRDLKRRQRHAKRKFY